MDPQDKAILEIIAGAALVGVAVGMSIMMWCVS